MTFSICNNGFSGSGGSCSRTSKAAPAIQPFSKAFINAFSSTVGPLPLLTNNAELLNKLDGYQEKLVRDIVIIDSLYL